MKIDDYSEEEQKIIDWFKKDREFIRLSFILVTTLLMPLSVLIVDNLKINFFGYGPSLAFLIIFISFFISMREYYLLNKKYNLFCSLLAVRMGFEINDSNTFLSESQTYELYDRDSNIYYSVYLGKQGSLIKQIKITNS